MAASGDVYWPLNLPVEFAMRLRTLSPDLSNHELLRQVEKALKRLVLQEENVLFRDSPSEWRPPEWWDLRDGSDVALTGHDGATGVILSVFLARARGETDGPLNGYVDVKSTVWAEDLPDKDIEINTKELGITGVLESIGGLAEVRDSLWSMDPGTMAEGVSHFFNGLTGLELRDNGPVKDADTAPWQITADFQVGRITGTGS